MQVVGWILLALSVALVNAESGLTALWVLLTGAGYTLFLLFPVKWGFRWLARRTGSLENGTPTAFMMTVTLVLVLFSAFFTDIIGIHAIFGGFLAGLIIPHDNGFAISLVEKLEDLVSLLFLPIVSHLMFYLSRTHHDSIVFCVLRIEDQPGILGQWYYMGLYRSHLCRCILLQVPGMRSYGHVQRIYLARIRCNRLAHELQRVR